MMYSITGWILPGKKTPNNWHEILKTVSFQVDTSWMPLSFLYYWHKLVFHGGKKKEPVSFICMQVTASLAKAISFSEKSCCQVKQNVFLWTDTVCGTGGYPITVSDSKEQLWQQREAVALSEVSLLMEGCSAPGGCDGSLAVLLWGWCPITGRIKVTYVLCVRAANRIVLELEVQ